MGKAAETGDLRTEPCFFGRSAELDALVADLALGRHTLCVGPKGVGKSRLMREAAAVFDGTRPMPAPVPPSGLPAGQAGLRKEMLYQRVKAGSRRVMFVTRTTPLGDFLLEMARPLHLAGCLLVPEGRGSTEWDAVRARLKRQGRAFLEDSLVKSLREARPPWLVFIDCLDRISPAHQPFLENLLTVAVVCAAVEVPREAPAFRKIWASFVRLDLGPLSREESIALIDHLQHTPHMSVSDPAVYRDEILRICGGNPFHIRNALWMGSRNIHVDNREIDRLRGGTRDDLFNMGPVYILAASILTLSKIFAFGTDNREFYIYFSALGFLVYLIFRVFRSFFLFRPQRRR